jgi:hypothetical protein
MTMNEQAKLADLVGRTIIGLHVIQGEHVVRVDTTSGSLFLVAVGDCCSETWFADIIGVDALIGGVVASVEETELPDAGSRQDGRTRQEVDEFYSITFVTNIGRSTIAYRNSSNGYYGGWCRVERDLPEWANGREWREIREDWSQ